MLELKNISMDILGEKEILKNVNLTVKDGQFIVITGPNGGGKSTPCQGDRRHLSALLRQYLF